MYETNSLICRRVLINSIAIRLAKFGSGSCTFLFRLLDCSPNASAMLVAAVMK